jgi:hypothetical protein
MIKTLLFSILMFSQVQSQAASQYLPAEPIINSRDCVLTLIAEKMEVHLKPEIALPRIRPQTITSLQEFQDSIEGFWHFRPDAFTNVYNPNRNEIFIMTERAYYERHQRSVYDSLAHELTHYLQKEYFNADFSNGDDMTWEMDAVYYQNWFRDTYKDQFQGDEFVCPL